MAKFMMCCNVRAGDAPGVGMPADKAALWQDARVRALELAIAQAAAAGASGCLVAGGLFGGQPIPKSLVERVSAILESASVPVTYVPRAGEAPDFELMAGTLSNVRVVRPEAVRSSAAGFAVPVRLGASGVTVTFVDCSSFDDVPLVGSPSGLMVIRIEDEVHAYVEGMGSGARLLPPLEPLDFGRDSVGGSVLVEVSGGGRARLGAPVLAALHPFATCFVELSGISDPEAIVQAALGAAQGIDPESCLHAMLVGRVSLDAQIDVRAIERALGERFFYAEVVDATDIDIDLASLDNDVSLLAEFIRIVHADASLSATERTRVLRYGWNALNGKELAR